MSIPFADQSGTTVGEILRRQLTMTSRAAFAASILAALEDAGWSADPEGDELPNATLTFTGIPANNETVVIGTVTYTWKTTLTPAANEVLRGASAAECAENLTYAINDESAYEGTKYGTGTAPNPHVSAELPTSTTVKVTGYSMSDAGLALSENSGSTSWSTAYLANACLGKLWSGRTPQGLQMKVEVWDPGTGTYARIFPSSYDGTIRIQFPSGTSYPYIEPTIGQQAEIIASKYHAVIYYPSFSYGYGSCVWGVPYLPAASAPSEVEGATKDSPASITGATNASPIEITSAGHGLSTGTEVYIEGVGGNTAANGTWIVAVTGTDTFTLDGSAGNGDYTSGGTWIRTAAVELTIEDHELEDGDKVYIDRGSLDPDHYQLNGQWYIDVVDVDTIRLRTSNAVTGDSYDTENPSLLACPTQCSQAFFVTWDKRGSNDSGLGASALREYWRNYLPGSETGGFQEGGCYGVVFNGTFWYDNKNGDFTLYANTPGRKWWGQRYWLREAVLAWSVRGYNGSDPPEGVGLMFDAAMAQCAIPMDSILTDTDGNKWLAFSYDRAAYGTQLLFHIPDGYN